jgi:hypothetical protein
MTVASSLRSILELLSLFLFVLVVLLNLRKDTGWLFTLIYLPINTFSNARLFFWRTVLLSVLGVLRLRMGSAGVPYLLLQIHIIPPLRFHSLLFGNRPMVVAGPTQADRHFYIVDHNTIRLRLHKYGSQCGFMAR